MPSALRISGPTREASVLISELETSSDRSNDVLGALVCPCCKSSLNSMVCARCGNPVFADEGILRTLTNSQIAKEYARIGAFYDSLYKDIADDPWAVLASRGEQFNKFVASLVAQFNPNRYLDVGCGEGRLLAFIRASDKHGIDISLKALRAAIRYSGATLSLGIAEELPYRTGFFEIVTSMGVMTHFVDDLVATKEVYRVLDPMGRYIIGIFLRSSIYEKVMTKIAEFIWPHPRPVRLLHWAMHKSVRLLGMSDTLNKPSTVYQPVERFYSAEKLEQLFSQVGFEISELITKRRCPWVPFAGSHFRIYVLKKR